ncbi:hypothetical protein BC827DRAFT_388425 [Russula dissimulans]|nr:hypothetical protein BC827DRAFT_388425 [Russula dissimulans]
MISNDTIALINTHGVALELCKIVTDPESCEPSLCRLVRLGLPPLASNVCIRWVDTVCPDTPCGAVEGRPPRRLPFQNSPEDGIAIFCINAVGPHDFDSLTIVTHLRTLLALATTTPPEVTFIPWKDWGPPVTACFEPTYFPLSHDLLAGERWVTRVLVSLCWRDFNSTRIQDSIRGTSDSARRGEPTKVVNHRRVVPRGLFKGVASELPYMIVHGPAPRGLNILALHEERAACICVDQEDGKQYVDIYST